MSWIRSLDQTSFDREVDFFYTVPNEHDAPYLEEIKEAAAQQPSLRMHLVVSEREGHLTPENVAKAVQAPLEEVWIYMCGPAQMMRSFERRFGQLGVRRSRIFWEHFELR
jgi:predicted ferric reductase